MDRTIVRNYIILKLADKAKNHSETIIIFEHLVDFINAIKQNLASRFGFNQVMMSQQMNHNVFMEPCIHLDSSEKDMTPLAELICGQEFDKHWPQLVDTIRNKLTHEWLSR